MSFKKILLVFVVVFASLFASAQQMTSSSTSVEMADGLYQSGKIYIVVIVIAIVFSGIVLYLIRLDKKISKLEKESTN
ncbi:MAG: CcmD family protein [Bacteroidota bacterium]